MSTTTNLLEVAMAQEADAREAHRMAQGLPVRCWVCRQDVEPRLESLSGALAWTYRCACVEWEAAAAAART